MRRGEIACNNIFYPIWYSFPFYMLFKMSSAICFNLDQSKILLSGNGLIHKCLHIEIVENIVVKNLFDITSVQYVRKSYLNCIHDKKSELFFINSLFMYKNQLFLFRTPF